MLLGVCCCFSHKLLQMYLVTEGGRDLSKQPMIYGGQSCCYGIQRRSQGTILQASTQKHALSQNVRCSPIHFPDILVFRSPGFQLNDGSRGKLEAQICMSTRIRENAMQVMIIKIPLAAKKTAKNRPPYQSRHFRLIGALLSVI